MCGICGFFEHDGDRPIDRATLVRMNRAISHRGPDDEGYFDEHPVALAMRRLSIIDIDGGQQPVFNEDRSISVVFNGEIYNYRELRAELETAGHEFRTNGDTEVIVHAYEQFGEACLTKFNGMFAFALWDGRHERLLLARDRFGIKPLHYAEHGNRFYFASEIKAILAAGIPRDLDPTALDQYLSHLAVPAPYTIYRAIRKLPAGHALVHDRNGSRILEYWDINYDIVAQTAEFETTLQAQLGGAIGRQLVSDVQVGAFLSGGLDSATVVAHATPRMNTPLPTFTIGFREQSYDERPRARLIARKFGTAHTEEELASDLPDLATRALACFDEPFADYSALAAYAVAEVASRSVKVVLSGDGGDEIFAGYQTHYVHKLARLYRRVPEGIRAKFIRPLVQRLPTSMRRLSFDYRAKRFIAGAELPFERGHLAWKEIFTEQGKSELLSPEFQNQRTLAGEGFSTFEEHFRKVRHLDPLHQLLYVDAKTFLTNDNLVKVDRTSMAHGLEVRVPLLDNNLVDFMAQAPHSLLQRGLGSKRLLRRAMAASLPKSVVHGGKKGFTPPMPGWLRHELRDFAIDMLAPERIGKIGLFQPDAVAHLLKAHLTGQRDNNRELWTLIAFSSWWSQDRGAIESRT
jgi:asparagine synthase (glutamine-hydrolysing)